MRMRPGGAETDRQTDRQRVCQDIQRARAQDRERESERARAHTHTHAERERLTGTDRHRRTDAEERLDSQAQISKYTRAHTLDMAPAGRRCRWSFHTS